MMFITFTGSLQFAVAIIPIVLAFGAFFWGIAWRRTTEISYDALSKREEEAILPHNGGNVPLDE
jgi:hypothetical protein